MARRLGGIVNWARSLADVRRHGPGILRDRPPGERAKGSGRLVRLLYQVVLPCVIGEERARMDPAIWMRCGARQQDAGQPLARLNFVPARAPNPETASISPCESPGHRCLAGCGLPHMAILYRQLVEWLFWIRIGPPCCGDGPLAGVHAGWKPSMGPRSASVPGGFRSSWKTTGSR
jgi:hypothetical protein